MKIQKNIRGPGNKDIYNIVKNNKPVAAVEVGFRVGLLILFLCLTNYNCSSKKSRNSYFNIKELDPNECLSMFRPYYIKSCYSYWTRFLGPPVSVKILFSE